MRNPLIELQHYGQSPWYDTIWRALITSGKLQKLIDCDGLRGVTSNPAIFEKAIASDADYNDALQDLSGPQEVDAKALYEHLAMAISRRPRM
jgi:transaldolase/glucose-6-phosphate isomerase